jgi:hypothetical protein
MIDLGKIGKALDVGRKVEVAEHVIQLVGRLLREHQDPETAETVMQALREQPDLNAELCACMSTPRTMYVAGWRPAVGWVCVAALGFIFLVNPILQWITGSPGPQFDTVFLGSLLATLFGLGGLRTVEKMNGRAQ